jgi:hypothetical protein
MVTSVCCGSHLSSRNVFRGHLALTEDIDAIRRCEQDKQAKTVVSISRKAGLMSQTTVTANRRQALKRRSSRLTLNAHVRLSGHDREKCAFTMPAKATNLNRHGAVIKLNRELLVGSTVVVQNSRSTQAPARVVTLVSTIQGVYAYGVEFLEDVPVKDFWGINFPLPAAERS